MIWYTPAGDVCTTYTVGVLVHQAFVRAMKSFIPSSIKLLNHWEIRHNPDSFYHHLYKYCFNYLFGICIYIFIIISTFDCIYFITTVFYGQPFICLIVLCMWCFNCGPSLCIMYFHVFMDQIKLLLLLSAFWPFLSIKLYIHGHDGDGRIDNGGVVAEWVGLELRVRRLSLGEVLGSKPIRRLSNVGQVRLPHVA